MKQKMNMNHLHKGFLLADYLICFNRNFKSINSARKNTLLLFQSYLQEISVHKLQWAVKK